MESVRKKYFFRKDFIGLALIWFENALAMVKINDSREKHNFYSGFSIFFWKILTSHFVNVAWFSFAASKTHWAHNNLHETSCFFPLNQSN